MTRISELFGLDVSQAALDFVDVDATGDVPAHIDPYAIATQGGWWNDACVALIQSYFESLLDAIHHDDKTRIRHLVFPTSEPNETHLGFSKSVSNGRGMGDGSKAEKFIERLTRSRAARTNLLTDIEDAALLIPGVGSDTISDIITSVIRHPLIAYTQDMCELHSIPMTTFPSGPIWDPDKGDWVYRQDLLPETETGKLILVPKSIVRVHPILDHGKFYRKYLREALWADREQQAPGSLTRLVNGKRVSISMKDFDKQVGSNKSAVERHAEKHPDLLAEYKKATNRPHRGYTQFDSDKVQPGKPVDFIALYDAIDAIKPGNAGAQSFHTAVANLLSAVFEGSLANLRPEYELNEGRKRVDITFDNCAPDGFFRFLSLNYPSALIFIECKNYSRDPANESIDQLSGRFAPRRGQVGILVCRELSSRELLLQRCKDTAVDGRGYLLVLDDTDLKALAEEARDVQEHNRKVESSVLPGLKIQPEYKLLADQFKALIS